MTVRFARALALASLPLAAPTPALATGEIACESSDGSASIAIGVGRLPILGVIGARVEVDGRVLSTDPEDTETAIAIGQAAQIRDVIVVDFTDPQISDVLVSLRLVVAEEGEELATGGVLSLRDEAARVVACELS